MYTKGEWKVKQKKPAQANFFDGFTLLVEDEKLLIALCDREGWDNHKERLANANLIAASPLLYEALKKLIKTNSYWWQEVDNILLEDIDKALAKANGQ